MSGEVAEILGMLLLGDRAELACTTEVEALVMTDHLISTNSGFNSVSEHLTAAYESLRDHARTAS